VRGRAKDGGMFEALKMAGALSGLMQNKDKIQATVARTKEDLAAVRIQGSSAGGVVKVTVTGQLKVVAVEIEPRALAGAAHPSSGPVLEKAIAEATNDALERAFNVIGQRIGKEAEALGLGSMLGTAIGEFVKK
jgi:nucleoid-associated protein EbfC